MNYPITIKTKYLEMFFSSSNCVFSFNMIKVIFVRRQCAFRFKAPSGLYLTERTLAFIKKHAKKGFVESSQDFNVSMLLMSRFPTKPSLFKPVRTAWIETIEN